MHGVTNVCCLVLLKLKVLRDKRLCNGDANILLGRSYRARPDRLMNLKRRTVCYTLANNISVVFCWSTTEQHPLLSLRCQVKVPAGVEDGNKLRVKGEGDAGAKGGPVGDLYVFLGVKSHPKFKRNGKDIYSDQTVTIYFRRRVFFCSRCKW